jgi:hypothetical protein
VSTAINHTELPFDEIIESRLRVGNFGDDTLVCRIMQDGWEIGTWIEVDYEGAGPVALKILAVNDLLAIVQRVHKDINGQNATLRATDTAYRNSPLCKALDNLVRDSAAAVAKALGQ